MPQVPIPQGATVGVPIPEGASIGSPGSNPDDHVVSQQPQTGALAALGRVGSGLVQFPGAVYNAFTSAPTPEEVQRDPRYSQPSALDHVGLGLRRLLIGPSEELRKRADAAKALSKTPGDLPDRLANLRRFGSYVPVPILGPLAESLVERGERQFGNDPSGALTELGGYVALPEVLKRTTQVATKVAQEPVVKFTKAMSNVGLGQAKRFAAETSAENAAETAKAAEATKKAQATVAERNAARTSAYTKRAASVAERNQAAKAQYESDLAAAKAKAQEIDQSAKSTETQRSTTARQLQEQSARLVNRVKQVQEQAKAKLGGMFEQVREKVGDTPVPRETLAADVEEARSKLARVE